MIEELSGNAPASALMLVGLLSTDAVSNPHCSRPGNLQLTQLEGHLSNLIDATNDSIQVLVWMG